MAPPNSFEIIDKFPQICARPRGRPGAGIVKRRWPATLQRPGPRVARGTMTAPGPGFGLGQPK